MSACRRIEGLPRWAVAALFGVITTNAIGAELNATVERNPIHLDETVRLLLESDSATASPGPDLSGLERDFELLGNSASTELRFENGRQSSRTRWMIELAPRRTGELKIPSLAVSGARSDPLTITVKPPRTDRPGERDIFLEAEAQPLDPYVNAQVIYTLRVYRAVEILEAKLSEPDVPDAVVRRLGKNVNYTATVRGKRYRVLERRYAIFPQSSGRLRIPPARLSGQIVSRRGGSSLSRLFGAGRPVRVEAKGMDLDVRPKPLAAGSGPWLPARSLTLEESWSSDPPRFAAGEPITWTLRMEASGLEGTQLPPLVPPTAEGIRFYSDQPLVESRAGKRSVHGLREHRIALVPSAPGEFELPEIVVRWWDVANNASREAVIPARRIQVEPGAAVASTEPLPVGAPAPTPATSTDPWFEVSAALFALWLLTLALWAANSRRRATNPPEARESPPRFGGLRRAVSKACRRGDPASARRALVELARLRAPPGARVQLRDVARCVDDSRIAHELDALERALYAPSPDGWDGSALAEIIESARIAPGESPGREASPDLAPLHPA